MQKPLGAKTSEAKTSGSKIFGTKPAEKNFLAKTFGSKSPGQPLGANPSGQNKSPGQNFKVKTSIFLHPMKLKLLFLGAGGTLVLIIILYGMSTIPFSYIVSFLAKTPASGFTMSIIVNILAGCIAPIAAYVLKGKPIFS